MHLPVEDLNPPIDYLMNIIYLRYNIYLLFVTYRSFIIQHNLSFIFEASLTF